MILNRTLVRHTIVMALLALSLFAPRAIAAEQDRQSDAAMVAAGGAAVGALTGMLAGAFVYRDIGAYALAVPFVGAAVTALVLTSPLGVERAGAAAAGALGVATLMSLSTVLMILVTTAIAGAVLGLLFGIASPQVGVFDGLLLGGYFGARVGLPLGIVIGAVAGPLIGGPLGAYGGATRRNDIE